VILLKIYLRKCDSCGKYSLEEKCECGEATVTPHPMKFSFEDKYAQYRRKAKYPEFFE